ncbi:MAG: DUF2849 domain-containing protein [Cohaesibacteraceae bacterium]
MMGTTKLSGKNADRAHILTANSLLTGRSLYWTPEGWSQSPDNAIRAENSEAVAALEARGKAEELVNMVVGAYVVPLASRDGNEPVAMRERRRIAGPSIALPGALTGPASA